MIFKNDWVKKVSLFNIFFLISRDGFLRTLFLTFNFSGSNSKQLSLFVIKISFVNSKDKTRIID